MSHDLYIAYAQQDSTAALELASKLRLAGYPVWLDESGIIGAERWSPEIVDSIETSQVVLLLLSSNANHSHHVHRQITYAADLEKNIIPIEMDRIVLSSQLKYPLAGLLRIKEDDVVGLREILTAYGIRPTSTERANARQSSVSQVSSSNASTLDPRDNKKSLMVLPFEDLSPTQDNGWFADGLTRELIAALGQIRTLRIIDLSTSMETKGLLGRTMFISEELDVRYFIEGHVRKFGDQIKVSVSLLDVQEGEHLWQDSHKGEFKDIFTIQEEVIRRAVEGLQLTLSPEEASKLGERGTTSSEAYEHYLKALDLVRLQTRDGYIDAIALFTRALQLDPSYGRAMTNKAHALVSLYRSYDRRYEYLVEAEMLSKRALELQSDYWQAYHVLSLVYQREGKVEEAEQAAINYVAHAPEDPNSHITLGIFYFETNQPRKAIQPFQQALFLRGDMWTVYQNLVVACDLAGETEEAEYWARLGLTYYQARLKLVPDDENAAIQYANLLRFAGKFDEAREALNALSGRPDLDGRSFYNIACLQSKLGDTSAAIDSLQRALDGGFSQFELFQSDTDLDPLRLLPEFDVLMRDVATKKATRKDTLIPKSG